MESGVSGERAGIRCPAGGGGGGWLLLEARLQGGAPWGFTLQGGLEHGEPLIISKVEEGGKADCLEQPLLTGDEIVIINEVELTGYRQEAIALVKGSYKTLQLVVRRVFDPGYTEEFRSSPPSLPTLSPPSPPPLSPSTLPLPHQRQTPSSSHHSRASPAGGVQLRIKNRRSEPASRPHSWHSTKLGEGQQQSVKEEMDTMTSSWHHSYHASASTTDLCGGFDAGVSYLRKSPDQYSSRGSMESLDPPQSSQLHSAARHHHQLGHAHSGAHPTYSSCHQLSSARSSNSIDHLHSKRDSAYSSFSTSSSIPEYLASTPSFSSERSYSLETVPQRGGGSGEMQHADMRYVRTVYDAQQGLSQEHELSSAAVLRSSDFRGGGVRPSQDQQGSVGGVCCHGTSSSGSSSGSSSSGSVPTSNRHSVGPIWGPAASCNSYESLKGAPAPPRRSDSYAAIRNHERPNSWSSLDHARSLRSLQKSSWHHSSGHLASGAGKGSYSTEGQLHTVIEKSPESSPTTKPRQSGGAPQPPSPPEPSSAPTGHSPQSGRFILSTGMHPVPQPEPHVAQMPGSNLGSISSGVFPALSKQNSRQQHRELQGIRGRDDVATEGQRDGRTSATQNGYHNNNNASSPHPQSSYSMSASSRLGTPVHGVDRSMDQTSIHTDPAFSRHAQEQPSVHPQSTQTSSCHLSDSADQSYQQWERREQDKHTEHPLTRLEIALADVQRCVSPDDGVISNNNHGNNSCGDDSHGPVRSLSVLEKVSRFERRERAGKQRSHSTSHVHNKAAQLRMCEKGRSSPCGAEDLRNMLERSTNGTKAHRTMSYRGVSSDCMKYRIPTDPSSALQRSRSSFQLEGSNEGDSSKDFHWRQDVQEMLGSVQDTFNNTSENLSRSYRDSVKDAQPKVLRSTSLRQRDAGSSISPPPSSVSPPLSSTSSQQHPSVPIKQLSLEKKGPKTMPKPQGVVIAPQTSQLVTSPHTPKEWHMVSPDIRGPSPPALPSIPAVGPPALLRICGRKRLTAEQKKRSYSEPENMNEVGVSDTGSAALFRRGGETSVADRRRMFELAASRVGGGARQNATSRPDLRQLQHEALAEYVERKRGVKREDGGHRSALRPHSAYLQPDHSYHTVSACYSDTFSLSSASSMLSLQDSSADQSFSSEETRLSSTLPHGADLRSLQSNFFYPGRVTTPRPPANPPPSGTEPQLQTLQTVISKPRLSRQSKCLSTDPDLGHQPQTTALQPSVGLLQQLSGALRRAESSRSSEKSASAEDLLERSEERQMSPHHYRSRSSPTIETLNQDFPPGDVRRFGTFISETVSENRCADVQVVAVSPHTSQNSLTTVQPAGASPVNRRERQRNCERQRAHSTSTLAASVGLPCPFTPPGTLGGDGTEWPASGRLSLDAIAFPGILLTSAVHGSEGDAGNSAGCSEALVTDSSSEDSEKDLNRGTTYSLETRGGHSGQQVSPVMATLQPHSQQTDPPHRTDSTLSPLSSSYLSIRHLSSLRISESSLSGSFDQQKSLESSTGLSHEDYDDVFLQNPPSPPPTIRETAIMEDFPPPPSPPLPFHLEHRTLESPCSKFLNHSSNPTRETSPSSPPVSPSSFPPTVPIPLASLTTSTTVRDSLCIEYQPLPEREKTCEELQVELLARRLVLQDPSLSPLLETWGSKTTVELMEEIFPNSKSQRRGSGQLDDRGAEIKLDDDKKDLNAIKVELCGALRSCVTALQQEKEELCEEQRHYQALGVSLETLVQELLKTNEKDKYSMFIGDLEKIVNLLLSLCSRLSRIDRSLVSLERSDLTQEDTSEERDSLHHKRSLLLRQTEDARELKENLDRRQRVVHAILSGYLTEQQLQDYRHFVSAKPSLLIRRRHLDDLIRQREEQLAQLAESLPTELAEAHDWSRASQFTSPSPMPCSSPFPPLLPPFVTPGPAHSVRSTTVTSL